MFSNASESLAVIEPEYTTLFQAYWAFSSVTNSASSQVAYKLYSFETTQGTVAFIQDPKESEWQVIVQIIKVTETRRRQGICTQFFKHLMNNVSSVLVRGVETQELIACLTKAGFKDQGGDFWWKRPVMTVAAASTAAASSTSFTVSNIECHPLSTFEKKIADNHTDDARLDEIIERLYLGPFTCLRDHTALKDKDVGFALNLSQRCSCIASRIGVQVMDIMVEDEPNVNLLCHLPKAYKFIDEALASGRGVLVNCIMGVSRSASVVIGYLMYKKQWTYEDSCKYVASKRPCIQPNPGFRFQLVNNRMPTMEEQVQLSAEHYADE